MGVQASSNVVPCCEIASCHCSQFWHQVFECLYTVVKCRHHADPPGVCLLTSQRALSTSRAVCLQFIQPNNDSTASLSVARNVSHFHIWSHNSTAARHLHLSDSLSDVHNVAAKIAVCMSAVDQNISSGDVLCADPRRDTW